MQFLTNLWDLFVDMSFYIVIGILFTGVLHAFVKKDVIFKHIGKKDSSSVVKAAVLGVPLPLCSCGVVPTAMYLGKSGASKGAVVSFLTSTPQTGVDSIIATYGLMGPVFAAYRAVAAFLSGIFAGIMTEIFCKNDDISFDTAKTSSCCGSHDEKTEEKSSCCCGSHKEEKVVEQTSCCCGTKKEEKLEEKTSCCCSSHKEDKPAQTSCCCHSQEEVKPVEKTSCCCASHKEEKIVEKTCCCGTQKEEKPAKTSCCSSQKIEKEEHSCSCSSPDSEEVELSLSEKIKSVFTYGFGSFLDEIALNFVVGLVIAALISTVIPEELLHSFTNPIVSMLLMLVIGIPMYVCSTASIPIAVSLIMKGITPGAAFVFLFAGPVTNIASLTILNKTLGKKVMAIYLGSVAVCSVAFGLILDCILDLFAVDGVNNVMAHVHSHTTPIYMVVVAVIFGLLVVRSLFKQYVIKNK